MAYDAAEVVRALERPTLTVERPWWQILLGVHHVLGRTKTYTGRILSHPEFAPLWRRWVQAREEGYPDDVDPDEESIRLVRDTCRAMGIPWRAVRRLPGKALGEAMQDFLSVQLRASGLAELAEQMRKQTSLHSPLGNGSPSGMRTRRSASGR